MRIVIDTNVFVAACLGSGPSNDVLGRCLTGTLTPLMGSALLAEYESLLGREDVFRAAPLDAGQRADLLDILLASAQWVRINFLWRPNLKDEADNHLVDLAIAGGARYIVTRKVKDFSNPDLRLPDLWIGLPEVFLKEFAP
ncbi:putative toxin-antitoxin system toxin component, PIN family [Roseospira navarrensis]|uniref:Putative toxin-antitoxin system toxin component, PIN family n=1 Tax=Roseospira navarrensis TaxID=140058 RepID=A0A7X1ZEI1_9PROT|nr:putative toxin-antitoxin system toxin component, PIN family [Roseospira navarrensis]MQX36544.1 putative toxin-antitoxin system toxin component, PIN family [Roseospira navarrensis]